MAIKFTRHGHAKTGAMTKEYRAWRGMISRCSGHVSQKSYIEKDIKVSLLWRNDFKAFFAYMGPSPGPEYSVERIKNNLGYEPGNVKWGTRKEQARNRDNNVFVCVDGERMLLVDAATKYSIKADTIYARLKRGWTDSRAVKTSIDQRQVRHR